MSEHKINPVAQAADAGLAICYSCRKALDIQKVPGRIYSCEACKGRREAPVRQRPARMPLFTLMLAAAMLGGQEAQVTLNEP